MQTQRIYLEHYHRPPTSTVSENLTDRVLRIGKTIIDLRRRLASEKELLEKEKMMTASMYLMPTTTEYYTLVYSKAQSETAHKQERVKEHTYHNEETFGYDGETFGYDGESLGYDDATDNVSDNLSLTNSEKNYITHERKKAVLSRIHAYRKHLKAVENKCKKELGAVKDSICNLKRVSTELNLEIAHDQRHSDEEKTFFYDD